MYVFSLHNAAAETSSVNRGNLITNGERTPPRGGGGEDQSFLFDGGKRQDGKEEGGGGKGAGKEGLVRTGKYVYSRVSLLFCNIEVYIIEPLIFYDSIVIYSFIILKPLITTKPNLSKHVWIQTFYINVSISINILYLPPIKFFINTKNVQTHLWINCMLPFKTY